MDDKKRLFVYNYDKWNEQQSRNYDLAEPPTVTEINDAIMLPLRRRTDVKFANSDPAFEGGVCQKDGSFVAGLARSIDNTERPISCTKAYSVPQNVIVKHETVVFGGVLFGHFGHMITEGLTRLWWLAEHPDTPYKIVFLDEPYHGGFIYHEVLLAAGISKDRMEIIREATRFDKVIVPQESLYFVSGYRPAFWKIYDYIRMRADETLHSKKIYLSRSRWKKNDTFNEQYFETFYKARGYEIVYPEQLPFSEQVSILAGADEVVTVSGTPVHMTHFCKPHTRVVILTRCDDIPLIIWGLKGRELDYYIVDAHYNFLPAMLGRINVYFLGPTVYWRDYLNKENILYKEEEVSFDLHVKNHVYDYIVKWGETNREPKYFVNVRNTTIVDVIDGISRFFCNAPIDRKLYPDRDDVVKLKKSTAALKNRVDVMENVIKSALIQQSKTQTLVFCANLQEAGIKSQTGGGTDTALHEEINRLNSKVHSMESSLSWRITKPLRIIKSWIVRLIKRLK